MQGEDGQSQLQPQGSVEEAVKAFEKKFKEKTKVLFWPK